MKRGIGRRDFLKRAGLAAGAAGVVPAQAGRRVAIRVADGHPPHVHWAAEELRRALAEHGVTATDDTSAADLRVVAEPIPQIPAAPPESLTFAPSTAGGRRTILASGSDARGVWFRAMWWVTTQKNGASALGLQRVLGLKKYETAWTWLHSL